MTSDSGSSESTSKSELDFLGEVNAAMQLLTRNTARRRIDKARESIRNKTRSEKNIQFYNTHPEARIKISQTMRRYWNDPSWRQRVIALRNSKEYRKKQSEGLKAARRRKHKLGS
jgi:hypothetical protein